MNLRITSCFLKTIWKKLKPRRLRKKIRGKPPKWNSNWKHWRKVEAKLWSKWNRPAVLPYDQLSHQSKGSQILKSMTRSEKVKSLKWCKKWAEACLRFCRRVALKWSNQKPAGVTQSQCCPNPPPEATTRLQSPRGWQCGASTCLPTSALIFLTCQKLRLPRWRSCGTIHYRNYQSQTRAKDQLTGQK